MEGKPIQQPSLDKDVSMIDWKQLVLESDEQLATRDIAEVNLACAAGLPGSVKIDYDLCRRKLDEWTRYCGSFIERVIAPLSSR
jgi:hypothetical protein